MAALAMSGVVQAIVYVPFPITESNVLPDGNTYANVSIKGNTMIKVKYEKPQVITYSEDEILDIIGPAQSCGSFSGSVMK